MKRKGAPSIRRVLVRASLLILAAAIINVAVAWGCWGCSSKGEISFANGFFDWSTEGTGWRQFVLVSVRWQTERVQAGLPILALSNEGTFDAPYEVTTPSRLLPMWPIWPGFAINTIFYAAMLWMLFSAPGFVRRRIRIKRGLCPACAYPTGASDVCTECGAPVRIQKP